MRTSVVLKCVLLTVFLPVIAVKSQSVVYSGSIGSPSLQIRNVANTSSFNFTINSAGEQIAIDANALTLTFQNFRIQTSSLNVSKNVSVTAGFGVTKDYTINLTFNANTYSFNDGVASHSLSATTGGSYDIQNTGNLGYVTPVGGGNVTGSYTIIGPTETVNGTFNVPANGSGYMIVPNTVNTTNYPSQLTLSHSNNQFNAFFNFVSGGASDLNFVSATVDGEQITWGFSQLHFSGTFGAVTPGALSAIPEPSTYAAIFGVTVLGFAVYLRRKKSV